MIVPFVEIGIPGGREYFEKYLNLTLNMFILKYLSDIKKGNAKWVVGCMGLEFRKDIWGTRCRFRTHLPTDGH